MIVANERIAHLFNIHIYRLRTPEHICRQLTWNHFFRRDPRIRNRKDHKVTLDPQGFSVFKKTGRCEVVAFDWHSDEVCDLGLEMTWPGIRDQVTVCIRTYEYVAQKVSAVGLLLPPDELAVTIIEECTKGNGTDESYDMLTDSRKVFNVRSDLRRTHYESYLEEPQTYRGTHQDHLRVDHRRSLLCLVP